MRDYYKKKQDRANYTAMLVVVLGIGMVLAMVATNIV